MLMNVLDLMNVPSTPTVLTLIPLSTARVIDVSAKMVTTETASSVAEVSTLSFLNTVGPEDVTFISNQHRRTSLAEDLNTMEGPSHPNLSKKRLTFLKINSI